MRVRNISPHPLILPTVGLLLQHGESADVELGEGQPIPEGLEEVKPPKADKKQDGE